MYLPRSPCSSNFYTGPAEMMAIFPGAAWARQNCMNCRSQYDFVTPLPTTTPTDKINEEYGNPLRARRIWPRMLKISGFGRLGEFPDCVPAWMRIYDSTLVLTTQLREWVPVRSRKGSLENDFVVGNGG
jgi:hypothetical protein